MLQELTVRLQVGPQCTGKAIVKLVFMCCLSFCCTFDIIEEPVPVRSAPLCIAVSVPRWRTDN